MEDKFNIVKKGYDPTEVNRYIEKLEAVIYSYKEKDTAIKNALISAQVAADNIVKNAELEADKITKKALILMDKIQESIGEERALLQAFEKDYNVLIEKYVHKVNDVDIQKLRSRIDDMENYIKNLNQDSGLSAKDTAPIPKAPASVGPPLPPPGMPASPAAAMPTLSITELMDALAPSPDAAKN